MKKENKKMKQAVICLCILLAGICYMAGKRKEAVNFQPELETASLFETSEARDEKQETPGGLTDKPQETEVSRDIFVHICGEVEKPGVYKMKEGSRVYEALTQAGGFTDKAAEDFLNMAEPLTDGMKIEVPDKETAEGLKDLADTLSGGSNLSVSGKVNINTAEKEQLMTLKGIGEARAEDIISYRNQNGMFHTIEDIMKVSGIKEAAFQKIKESITV